MSPLWRDEVGICLAPRKVRLVRMGRGVRPSVRAEKAITVHTAHYGDWAPALATLSACLNEPLWQRANARVVLSDHWVRYASLPWSSALRTPAERLSHAHYALADVYGDQLADWNVTLSDVTPGTAQVACAIPAGLATELSGLIETRGSRLISLQPQLVMSFNRWRHHLPRSGAWFVSIEEGSLAAVRLAQGGWDRVRTVRIASDWLVELKRLRTFGRLASTRPDDGRVFVEAPLSLREVAGRDDPGFEWLEDSTFPIATLDKLAHMQRLQA